MKRSTTKTFDMVPTLQQGRAAPAPVSLLPALPVRLGSQGRIQRFAAIDTRASISKISRRLWLSALSSAAQHEGTDDPTEQRAGIARLGLWICDDALNPWIELRGVPFLLVTDEQPGDEDIALGYDSCLAHLRLVMDYPKGKVSVSASIKWLRATADQSSPALSARMREGEKLFRMGSYDAAVAMLAAGLEEYLQEYVPMQQSISTLGRLSRFLELGTLGPEFQTQLATVMDIRRRAVHGTDRESVDRAEAEKVRRAVRTIIKKLPSKIDVIVS